MIDFARKFIYLQLLLLFISSVYAYKRVDIDLI